MPTGEPSPVPAGLPLGTGRAHRHQGILHFLKCHKNGLLIIEPTLASPGLRPRPAGIPERFGIEDSAAGRAQPGLPIFLTAAYTSSTIGGWHSPEAGDGELRKACRLWRIPIRAVAAASCCFRLKDVRATLRSSEGKPWRDLRWKHLFCQGHTP